MRALLDSDDAGVHRAPHRASKMVMCNCAVAALLSRGDTLDNFFIINMTYWILMKCKIGNVFDKA